MRRLIRVGIGVGFAARCGMHMYERQRANQQKCGEDFEPKESHPGAVTRSGTHKIVNSTKRWGCCAAGKTTRRGPSLKCRTAQHSPAKIQVCWRLRRRNTMNILFHTIAVEPARWTPQRISRPLVELLPHIATSGFHDLEIFEPHLTAETISAEIRDGLAQCGLRPVVLSSYLNLNPAQTSDGVVDAKLDQIAERITYYGFKKLRLFPGPAMNPVDDASIKVFTTRLQRLVN